MIMMDNKDVEKNEDGDEDEDEDDKDDDKDDEDEDDDEDDETMKALFPPALPHCHSTDRLTTR